MQIQYLDCTDIQTLLENQFNYEYFESLLIIQRFHAVLAAAMHVKAVARAIMFATEATHKPRRRHVRLNVVANVLPRSARFATKLAEVVAIGGFTQQLVDPQLQLGDFFRVFFALRRCSRFATACKKCTGMYIVCKAFLVLFSLFARKLLNST